MGWSDEPAKDFNYWRGQWDGSMMCACDHGCNQWLKNNMAKASLIMHIQATGGKTSLDKIAKMENAKSDKLWYKFQMRLSRIFNERLRKAENVGYKFTDGDIDKFIADNQDLFDDLIKGGD